MQPAALTASPPSTIQPTNGGGGGARGWSHNAQPAGISRISRPLGLCQRTSSSEARRSAPREPAVWGLASVIGSGAMNPG